MIQIMFRRGLSQISACLDGGELRPEEVHHGLRDKSADYRRAHVVGWFHFLGVTRHRPAGLSCQMLKQIKASCAVGLSDGSASSR